MGRPYSLDLCERVVGAVFNGQSVRAAAAIFDVSVSSVVNWSQRARAIGSPAAEPMGSPLKRKLLEHRTWILNRLEAKRDITLRALVSELQARGIEASYGFLWRLLDDKGISFKKSLHAGEQDRPNVARGRVQRKKYQGRLDLHRLVFIDETWAKGNMTRTHAAPMGGLYAVKGWWPRYRMDVGAR